MGSGPSPGTRSPRPAGWRLFPRLRGLNPLWGKVRACRHVPAATYRGLGLVSSSPYPRAVSSCPYPRGGELASKADTMKHRFVLLAGAAVVVIAAAYWLLPSAPG